MVINSVREKLSIRITKRHLRLGVRLMRRDATYPMKLLARWTNRAYHRRGLSWEYNENGIDVFAQEWDNLLILDGCRTELLRDNPLDGDFRTVTSRGSDTNEFLRGNCPGNDLSDTVYVSANPVLYWHDDTIDHNFHDVVFVWEEDGWDERYRTVLPEVVTEYASEAAERYPNKRLLVHYLQPHYPFIDTDIEIDKRQMHAPGDLHPSFWRAVETGMVDITREDIWELYRANLERTLPHVEELCDRLDGKTVVTSDHGNMIGEPSRPLPIAEWGHPPGTYTDELVEVPWIELDADSRRSITAEEHDVSTSLDRSTARERLDDLGYVV